MEMDPSGVNITKKVREIHSSMKKASENRSKNTTGEGTGRKYLTESLRRVDRGRCNPEGSKTQKKGGRWPLSPCAGGGGNHVRETVGGSGGGAVGQCKGMGRRSRESGRVGQGTQKKRQIRCM